MDAPAGLKIPQVLLCVLTRVALVLHPVEVSRHASRQPPLPVQVPILKISHLLRQSRRHKEPLAFLESVSTVSHMGSLNTGC